MEPVVLARIALARLGLIGKGDERNRRPTQDELDRLIAAFEANLRQQIPLGRIVRFAVATAMRQEEICRIEWADFDRENKMLLIRDRKDPRRKNGTISAFHSSMFAAMTLAQSSTSNTPILERAPDEYFLTMADQLARHSVDSAKN
jgi:integrase